MQHKNLLTGMFAKTKLALAIFSCTVFFIAKTTAQAIPANVSATDGAYFDSVKISVNITDIQFLRFFRSTTNSVLNATPLSGILPAQASFFDVTGTPGVQYYYFAQGYSSSAGLNPSAYSNIDVGHKKLKRPRVISVWGNNCTSPNNYMNISWDSVPGMKYVWLLRSSYDNINTAIPVTGWITGRTFKDYNVTPGELYYYFVFVSAYPNGHPLSDPSLPERGYLGASVPWNVKVSRGTNTEYCTVTFNGIWGHYFQVLRSTTNNPASATPISGWIYSVRYDDKTAVPGTLYYYYVRSAYNLYGSCPSVPVRSDTSGYRLVGTPYNVRASQGTYYDHINITWAVATPNPGTYYRVYRGTSSNPNTAIPLGGGWSPYRSYDDYTVPNSSTYYYFVRASNSPYGDLPSNFSSYGKGYKKYSGARSLSNSFEVYPNPAVDNKLQINYKINQPLTVIFTLLNDKQIAVKKISAANNAQGEYSLTIDISQLSIGVYTLIGQIGNEVISKKIIKTSK